MAAAAAGASRGSRPESLMLAHLQALGMPLPDAQRAMQSPMFSSGMLFGPGALPGAAGPAVTA